MCTYHRKESMLQDLIQERYEMMDLMEFGCENCKRKDPTGEYSGMHPSSLKFTLHQVSNLIKRRGPFVFLCMDRNSDQKISLCVECSVFYTNTQKEGRLF